MPPLGGWDHKENNNNEALKDNEPVYGIADAIQHVSARPRWGSRLRFQPPRSPLISNDPPADDTDLYAFVSPDKPDTVTIIVNIWPFEEPAGGPNYFTLWRRCAL